MPVTNETSGLTYQNFDGSNTTMLMRSFHYKPQDDVTLTAAFGGSTNFNGTNSFVLEGKAKYAVDEHFGVQVRSRNSFNTGNSNSQMRLAAEYKTKISDKTSIYVDAYGAAKYHYANRNLTTDVGVFGGVTYDVAKNFSVSGELQKYNGLNGGAENLGANLILSYKF